MIPPPLRGFVEKLKTSTDNQEVKWQEGGTQTYFCNHKSYSLYLNYHFNDDTEIGSYYFTISKNDKDSSFSVLENEADYWLMRNLFHSVSVSASQIYDIESDFFS